MTASKTRMLKVNRESLTDSNFVLLAAKWYDKTSCIMSEFEHDIKRLKYLKRLFRKYKKTGELRERLVLNHIIILGNVFGPENSVRMLYLKIDKHDWDVLKTFLICIEQSPNIVYDIDGHDIITTGIPVDMEIANRLRRI